MFSPLYFLQTVHLQAGDQESKAESTKPQNEWCPVLTDEPIEPEFTIFYKKKPVGLCCDKCKRKFLKQPNKYLKNLPQFNDTREQGEIDSNLEPEKAPPQGEKQSKIIKETEDQSFLLIKDEGNQAGTPISHHAQQNNFTEMQAMLRQVYLYAGKFHPLAVHFPIALTITAAFSEAIFMRTQNLVLSNVARINLIAGGFSAILAAILGWANGEFIRVTADMESVLFLHQWLGLSSTLCLICAIVFSELARRWDNVRLNLGYRICLFTAALLVMAAGHFGGTLVFGKDYFNWQ